MSADGLRCPVCRYSLDELDLVELCPECGVEIRAGVIESDRFRTAVRETRNWGVVGVVSHLVCLMMYIAIMADEITPGRTNAPWSISLTGWVMLVLPVLFMGVSLVLLFRWTRQARSMIYRVSIRHPDREPDVLKRVAMLAAPVVFPASVIVLFILPAMLF